VKRSAMAAYIFILWLLFTTAVVVIYMKYARANYPSAWRWEYLLLGSSFVWGGTVGLLLSLDSTLISNKTVLTAIMCGLAAVVLFRFIGVARLRHLLPQKTTPPTST
jgi:hypothetical protein